MSIDNCLLQDGTQYLRKVAQLKPENSKLTPEIIYNMLCLGLETSFTALLFAYNSVIDHGSVSALVRALQKHQPVPEHWLDEARFLNRFNTYCPLDKLPPRVPTCDETYRMIRFASSVLQHIEKENYPHKMVS